MEVLLGVADAARKDAKERGEEAEEAEGRAEALQKEVHRLFPPDLLNSKS